jgi:MFS family permease
MDSLHDWVQRNALHNAVVIITMIATYNAASSFIYGSTILSVYASHLTSSAMLVGLIPAIQSVGMFLPQLLLVRQIQAMPHKHPFVVRMAIPERLPYLVIGLSILLWPQAPKPLAYGLLALGLAVGTFSGGVMNPAITSIMATAIQPRRRGAVFGVANALGGLLGSISALAGRRILASYYFPTAYGICFLASFSVQLFCFAAVSLLREPPELLTPLPAVARDYWRRLPGMLKRRPNFQRYLLARVILAVGGMGTAFYILYARQRFGVDDAFAGNLTLAALLGQTVATPLLGLFGDRWGHKHLLVLGAAMVAVAQTAALLATHANWFYLTFALTMAGSAGIGVAVASTMMEFFQPNELPTYSAISATLIGIALVVAPLIGGRMADVAGFRWVFVVALVGTLAGGAIMHWTVRLPAAE